MDLLAAIGLRIPENWQFGRFFPKMTAPCKVGTVVYMTPKIELGNTGRFIKSLQFAAIQPKDFFSLIGVRSKPLNR